MTERRSVALRVRVSPRAKRTALVRSADGSLRFYLTAAPVEGAANRALLAVLAEALDLPKSALAITRGERSRDKIVTVSGLTAPELDRLLAETIVR
jgi:uncharacterized protein YggU (UPF0235/DUF167 family)